MYRPLMFNFSFGIWSNNVIEYLSCTTRQGISLVSSMSMTSSEYPVIHIWVAEAIERIGLGQRIGFDAMGLCQL